MFIIAVCVDVIGVSVSMVHVAGYSLGTGQTVEEDEVETGTL